MSLDAWRLRATNTYSLLVAAVHLVAWASVAPSGSLPTTHKFLFGIALSLTVAAAAFRRLPVTGRVLLLLAAAWVYAFGMLDRGGVFMNARLPLVLSPLLAFVLVGFRLGLAAGAFNLILLGLAFLGTEAGWLRQASPQWLPGEWRIQFAATVGGMVPHLLLLAWFSHHLMTSIRREAVTAARLRAEAADRERLEVEVLEAGERESRRIGAEIHDGVCQDLTGILIRAKRAQKALEAEARPEAGTLAGIVEGLGEAIGDVHGLAKRLSPGRLTGRDLVGALGDLVQRTAEIAEANVGFRSEPFGTSLDGRTTLQLYRIAQEALANAVRHSGASRIEVVLSEHSDAVVLRVDDDGSGLPANAQDGEGLGLHLMQWRAAKVGGTLIAQARPGGGTRVECRMPVPAAERPQAAGHEEVDHGG